jgi:hypothetical protein
MAVFVVDRGIPDFSGAKTPIWISEHAHPNKIFSNKARALVPKPFSTSSRFKFMSVYTFSPNRFAAKGKLSKSAWDRVPFCLRCSLVCCICSVNSDYVCARKVGIIGKGSMPARPASAECSHLKEFSQQSKFDWLKIWEWLWGWRIGKLRSCSIWRRLSSAINFRPFVGDGDGAQHPIAYDGRRTRPQLKSPTTCNSASGFLLSLTAMKGTLKLETWKLLSKTHQK